MLSDGQSTCLGEGREWGEGETRGSVVCGAACLGVREAEGGE